MPLGFHYWSLLKVENGFALRASDVPLTTLVWSPDSTMVAVGSGITGNMRNGSIWIWKTETSTLKQNLAGPTVPVKRLEFSPDNYHLASYSDYEVYLWNTGLGIQEQMLPVCADSAQWGKGATLLVINGGFTPSPTPRVFKTSAPNQWQISGMKSVKSVYVPTTYALERRPVQRQLSPDNRFYYVHIPPPPSPLLPRETRPFPMGPTSRYASTSPKSLLVQSGQTFMPGKGEEEPDGTIEIRQVQGNVLLKSQLRHNFKKLWWQDARHIRGIALVTAGTRFLEARLWDFDCQTRRESWQHLNVLDYDDIHISPDKRWMSWDEITKMRLFDLKRRTFVSVWNTDPDWRTKSAFSPNSRNIAWLDGSAVRVQRLDKFTPQ